LLLNYARMANDFKKRIIITQGADSASPFHSP